MKSKSIKLPHLAIGLLLASLAVPSELRSQPSANCVPPAAGIVGWWRAENNALDSAGTNNGTLLNGTSFAAGEVGQAFSFDGVSTAVRIPASPDLNVGLGNGLTMEAWIKPTTVSGWNPIIEWTTTPSSGAYGVHVWVGFPGPGYLFANIADVNGFYHQLQSPAAIINPNQFQHIAVTYDKTTGVGRMLLNGVVIDQENLGVFQPQTSYDVYIGQRPPGAINSGTFAGLIDEASIYNRALATNEIWAIYNAGTVGKCPPAQCTPAPSGLISWWQGEGNANDATGGNNGTILDGITFVPGKVAQALNFDGVTGAVTVPAAPNLAVRNFTFETWIFPTDISIPRPIIEYSALSGEGSPLHFWYSWTDAGTTPGALYGLVRNANGVGGLAVSSAGGLIPSNQWSHVAFTYDESSSTGLLYINGVNVASNTSPTAVQMRTDVPVNLGYRPDGSIEIGAGRRHLGKLDEVSIYGRVLSAAEIRAVYQAGSAGKCPPIECTPSPSGLISWWQGEGNANDPVGGNNGTILSGITFQPGEVNEAFNFDGVTGAVTVPAASNLAVRSFTFEAWVSPKDITIPRPIIEYSALSGDSAPLQFWYSWNDAGTTPGALYGLVRDASGIGGLAVNSPGGLINSNQWSHVAFTYDEPSSTGLLYVNGVNVGSNSAPTHVTMRSGVPVNLGYRPDGSIEIGAGRRHVGGLDEVSIYGRVLSAAEIQAVYHAGSAGKCPPAPTAPVITAQPQSQSVVVGAPVSFNVAVSGTAPFTYQWRKDGAAISGATDSAYAIASVQLVDQASYSVAVSNSVGGVISSNAHLTVNFPPALLRVSDRAAAAGGAVVVPVTLMANGNENAVGFSLNFDPALLTFSGLSLGSGSVGAALLVNDSQAASGKVGAAIGLAAGTTFGAGTQEVALVTFNVGIVTNATSTTVSFGSVPIAEQLTDAAGGPLAVNFANGTVAIAAANLEGDVWPRPDGDKVLNLSDWVTVGRYVARLDYPTNASEFQRADCAPRATLGDGYITVIDWVQAGRYAAGLDPLTVAGGPTSEGPLAVVSAAKGVSRQLSAGSALMFPNQTGTVSVMLSAQGDENALGFSLQFDPAVVSYQSASVGTGISGAVFNVNSLNASSGRLGFALALQSGLSFPTGVVEVVKVNFRAANAPGNSKVLLTDTPVTRQVSSPGALPLPTAYFNGSITLNAPPSLSIAPADQGVVLSWPVWATNFVLESFGAPLTPSAVWTNVPASVIITPTNQTVTLPLDAGPKFYRLRY